MKCVILQPSYIPWRGFFHQIMKADLFIFYDDVQYDRRGWRNRNRIKTSQGSIWLSIPVYSKGVQANKTPINEIKIRWDQPWNRDHWKTIEQSYGKAPFFSTYAEQIRSFYDENYEFLADFTIEQTISISRMMGITRTQFIRSSSLNVSGTKTDRLLEILQQVGADHYISGPSAEDYIETEKFLQNNIHLEYMDYNYPEYSQLYSPYEEQISILDLLFMTGQDALHYIDPDYDRFY